MKKTGISLLLTFAAFLLPVNVFAGEKDAEESKPQITFEKTSHNFGLFDVEHGNQVCWFKFTNTGDKELVILSATASCGCTEPTYPQTPILPGQSDSIKVEYNGATRRPGVFRKTIIIMTNTPEKSAYLYITGEMVEKLVEERLQKPEADKED